MLGHFKKAGVSTQKHVQEIRLNADDLGKYKAGENCAISDIFQEGQRVDVTGTSKGRGFAGVMKRYNFAGFISSHGTHEFFRHGGSIGTRLTPGHVLKGKKMPGHMGAERVTVQGLTVAKIDADRFCMTNVQIAIGLGWETSGYPPVVGACLDIGFDDVTDKI